MSGAKGPSSGAPRSLYGQLVLQAYAELLLSSASGDVQRIQELCEQYNIQVR